MNSNLKKTQSQLPNHDRILVLEERYSQWLEWGKGEGLVEKATNTSYATRLHSKV